ncbi:hypothetical protein [Streptomyces kanamyceticus]|uniref:Uncharacterized protein n=1 Tax=Streptomyces kanamyceticus TaxID=1967 RepID=A0A5J6GAW0_STRKN|nr:hypothetical protein [Streptomyces kanamyceticus]QEU90971.1 hypothetical protein CP970_08810 [Streptomyces kanamyceticus]
MQGTPHIASTPHDGRSSPIPPARGAQPQRTGREDPQLPVFVDQSGWRKRTLQGMALVVGSACVGYLAFVGTLVSGLQQPVGTHPPSTKNTTDTTDATDTTNTADKGGRARSGQHADKSSYGSGRSVPPPAGASEQ